MKVKALMNLIGSPALIKGKEYDIDSKEAKVLIERGICCALTEPKKPITRKATVKKKFEKR